jgi:hypothetical protein
MSRGKDGGGEGEEGLEPERAANDRRVAGQARRGHGHEQHPGRRGLELVGAAVARSVPLRDNLTRVLKSESGR